MKNALITFMLIIAVVTLNAQDYMRLEIVFHSPALNEDRNIDIYLPSNYYVYPDSSFAKIYYLHEEGDDQMDGLNPARKYYQYREEECLAAIFVVPDGSTDPYLGSCFMNSSLYGNFEDYLLYDVISFVEANFRAYSDKNFRFITGYNLGAYAAAYMAVNHPDKFRACFLYNGLLSLPMTTLNAWKQLCYDENNSYTLDYNAGDYTQGMFTLSGAFLPNPGNLPGQVDLPFDESGDWIPAIMDKWNIFDLCRKVKYLPDAQSLSWYMAGYPYNAEGKYDSYLTFTDSLNYYNIDYKSDYSAGSDILSSVLWVKGIRWVDSLINRSYQIINPVSENATDERLTLFPNPCTETITISYISDKQGEFSVEIINQLGTVLYSGSERIYQNLDYQLRVSTNEWKPGVYFCRVNAGGTSNMKKVVKTN